MDERNGMTYGRTIPFGVALVFAALTAISFATEWGVDDWINMPAIVVIFLCGGMDRTPYWVMIAVTLALNSVIGFTAGLLIWGFMGPRREGHSPSAEDSDDRMESGSSA